MRSLRLIRPKSNATVVVVLRSTPAVSSTPCPACVITSSVFNGRISLTERTRVVLPAPKPPTTTIFRPVSAAAASGVRWEGSSEVAEPIEDLLEQGGFGKRRYGLGGAGVTGADLAHVVQVADEDAGDRDGQLQLGGDLHQRRGVSAQLEDPHVLRLHAGTRFALADDQSHQVERVVGRAAPARDHVEPVWISDVHGFADHARAPRSAGVRGSALRCSPICSTSSVIW